MRCEDDGGVVRRLEVSYDTTVVTTPPGVVRHRRRTTPRGRCTTPPSYDTSRRRTTPPSYDASGPSYDTTVVRRLPGVVRRTTSSCVMHRTTKNHEYCELFMIIRRLSIQSHDNLGAAVLKLMINSACCIQTQLIVTYSCLTLVQPSGCCGGAAKKFKFERSDTFCPPLEMKRLSGHPHPKMK